MLTLAAIAMFLIVLAFGARWFANADPKGLVRAVKWIGGFVAVAVILFLVMRGGAGILAPLAIFLLPMVRRWLRAKVGGGWTFPGGSRPSGSSGQSGVETATLRMNLEHDTGRVGGEIKQGPFAGRTLDGLALSEVIALLRWCEMHDAQSVGLVEAFLDRTHGADWRDQAEAGGAAARPSGTSVTRAEAFEVLGLAPGASEAEIRAAYHRLMLKVHPDQGGSTFLAAKINQAKDLLLGN